MPNPTDNQIEDIFQSVDKAPKQQNRETLITYTNPAEAPNAEIQVGISTKKKIWFTIGLILFVLIVSGVIYIMIKQFGLFQKPTEMSVDTTPEVGEVVVPEEEVPAAVVEVPLINDADADGLSLEEETKLQTNPAKSDTDSDGLSDFDEAMIFLTDPLNADTDGDTYIDGEEVSAGFNPNGDGVLLNFDRAKQELNKKP